MSNVYDFSKGSVTPVMRLYYNLRQHKGVFLTGGGGVGKSYLTKELIKKFKNPLILGSTNQAAILVGGQTVHDFFKLYDCKNYKQVEARDDNRIEYLKNKHPLLTRDEAYRIIFKDRIRVLEKCDLIVIDEISMLSKEVFNLFIWRLSTWVSEERFYNIPILVVGDFYQLPPVRGGFAFESPDFKEFKVIELDEVKRTSNKGFIDVLKNIRKGRITDRVDKALTLWGKKWEMYSDNDREDTFLHVYPINDKVFHHNKKMLEKIDESEYMAQECEVTHKHPDIKPKDIEVFIRDSTFEEVFRFKIGAKVVFIANHKEFYNGMQGEIVSAYQNDNLDYVVKVKTAKGVIDVEMFPFQKIVYKRLEGSNRLRAINVLEVRQIPLKLAYAITVHKSQGLTFELPTAIDCERMFVSGQFYVALSRATDPNNVIIRGLNRSKHLAVNQKVSKYYRSVEAETWIGY